MNVGEIKQLNFYPNPQPPALPPANPVSLTGATCTLKVLNPVTGLETTLNLITVNSDPDPINHYAYYVTTANDFPNAGNYTIQLIASYGGGVTLLKSSEILFQVGYSL